MTAARIDHLNSVLILLTCVAAHLFPYHLLLFSYAVLGPAHYLTQISWLHDKRYFANARFVAPLFTLVTLLLMCSPSLMVSAILLSITLGVALAYVLPGYWRIPGAFVGAMLAWLVSRFGPAMLFIALLLPTVLHVFIFTACFMWAGAIRSRNGSAYLSILLLLAGAASFLLPMRADAMPDLAGLAFFKPVVDYLQSMLSLSNAAETRLFGFLSFAYTYHYLNWFSKAEVIRWHRIPRKRLLAIIMLYVIALSVYAYDYKTGFFLLLFLSVLHVLLEFPLNFRTFAAIGASFKRSL